jgi:hypothetical protein
MGKDKKASIASVELEKPEVKVFDKVEKEASFPDGVTAWRKFLERNVNPEVPANNYAPPGTYTVIVQFIVDKNGTISEIKPLTKHGFGMEEEVLRVIKMGPNWLPATIDGKPVKAYRKQPLTFQVDGEFELSTYILYAGKENLVELKEMDSVKDEDIVVTVSSGSISMVASKKYVIKTDKPGNVLLTVHIRDKKKMVELGKIMLQVK